MTGALPAPAAPNAEGDGVAAARRLLEKGAGADQLAGLIAAYPDEKWQILEVTQEIAGPKVADAVARSTLGQADLALSGALNEVADRFQDIGDKQREALEAVKAALLADLKGSEKKPSLAARLLADAAKIAVTTTLDAVGAIATAALDVALEKKVEDAAKEYTKKVLLKAASEVGGEAVKNVVEATLEGTIVGEAGENGNDELAQSIEVFCEGQVDALDKMVENQRASFNNHWGDIAALPDPMGAARALQDALGAAKDQAKRVQTRASFDAWEVKRAQDGLQVTDEGATDMADPGAAAKRAGVLTIEFATRYPGDPIAIERASLDRVGKETREYLEDRALDDIAIPKVFDGKVTTVTDPKVVESRVIGVATARHEDYDVRIRLGVDEGGAVSVGGHDDDAFSWLTMRDVGMSTVNPLSMPDDDPDGVDDGSAPAGAPDYSHVRNDDAWGSARSAKPGAAKLVHDDMGKMTLDGKLGG